MKIIIVDDERIILQAETKTLQTILPNAQVVSFTSPSDALEYAQTNEVDVAFLDINMRYTTGLELARKIQQVHPKVNIIFCTGHSEYALESYDLYCSAYIKKPLTEEKVISAMSNLRHPVVEKPVLKVCCFGNFEVYVNDKPVGFKYSKTKEVFAYLIDRNGVDLNTKEVQSAIFEDENKSSYFRNMLVDLVDTFARYGFDNVIRHGRGVIGVNKDAVVCDYYDYLNGNTELFMGEYMSQYSFGEVTLGMLMDRLNATPPRKLS